jgi:uracil-DNA glycosylase family 4
VPASAPAVVAPTCRSWSAVAPADESCVTCGELAATRTRTVPGVLPEPGSGLLLVGEAPGAQEDQVGRPFVGRSGELLDTLLAEAGLERAEVAIANVLKCRPPGNRAPRKAEVEACRPWLVRQLELARPAVVLALGGTAATWFHGPSARIGALRDAGAARRDDFMLITTYHPSAALRFGPNGAPLAALRADLALAADLLQAPGAAR